MQQGKIKYFKLKIKDNLKFETKINHELIEKGVIIMGKYEWNLFSIF